MFSYLSSVEIEESQFSDNSAEDGGGIYFFVSEGDKNPKSITSTLVCGNTLDQIYGEWTDNGGNTIEDVCPDDCPDVNDDGVVDVLDLLFVISDWNTCADNCDGDVNGDGTVDINDLLIVVAAWGPCE
jgi:hypothetical protein